MKAIRNTAALLLSICKLFSALRVHGFAAAADGAYGPYEYDRIAVQSEPKDMDRSATMNRAQKAFYNVLNAAGDVLLRIICGLYAAPRDWKDVSEIEKIIGSPEAYTTTNNNGGNHYDHK